MSRYQENTRHKRMWFGTQHHSEWITCPLRGAEMTPESWGTEGTYLSGGGFVRQSQDSHRQYIFEWSGASSRASAEIMQAYRDGVYNRAPSDLIYFIDPLMYKRNILPKRWAQPGILTVEGSAEHSPLGVVAPIDTPPSVHGNQRVPLVGAQVSSPLTSLSDLHALTGPGVGAVWIPVPEGKALTVIAWTGDPTPSESGLYIKSQAIGGSWQSPEKVGKAGITVSGVKGFLLATVGFFNFYGARAVIGRGEGWTEPAVYDWTGSPNNSASTRTTPEGVVTNLFTNPDMVLSSTNTVVRRNLLPHPAPPQDRNTTNPPGWTITRGDFTVAALTDLLSTGGKFPPEGLSGIKGVRSGNFGSGIFPSDPPPIEFISGADAESRASVTSGTTYYASMYMWKRGWEGEKAEMPVRAVIRWYNSSGNAISDSVGSDVDLSDGGWGLLEVSGSAPGGAVSAAVIGQLEGFSGFLPNNHYTYATGAILQTSPGPYFDGDFSLQDGTTAWSGTPGESPSSETVDLGSEVVVWENLIPNPSFEHGVAGTGGWGYNQTSLSTTTNSWGVVDGSRCLQIVAGSGFTNQYFGTSNSVYIGQGELSEGDFLAVSYYMRRGAATPLSVRFRISWRDEDNVEISNWDSDYINLNATRSSEDPANHYTFVAGPAPAGVSHVRLLWWVSDEDGQPWTELKDWTIHLDAVIAASGASEQAALGRVATYFDGDTSFDSDLTSRWTGTPGDSTSQLVGQEVAGMTPTNGVVVKSSQWSKSGGVSARFITTSEATGNNLPIGIVGVFGSPVGGVVVWRRQDAPIGEFEFPTGDSNLSILTGTGDASAPAVNAPGETLMRVELGEIAPNGVQVYLPGGGNVGDSVWFDILTVTDGSYDGPPFSGSSPTEGPKWLPGSGNSGCKFVGNPTWIANSGVNGGQIGYAATLKEVGD